MKQKLHELANKLNNLSDRVEFNLIEDVKFSNRMAAKLKHLADSIEKNLSENSKSDKSV